MHKEKLEMIASEVIGAAIEVHRILGPGLLESTYEKCLCKELDLRKINYKRQEKLIVNYKGEIVEESYRLDIIVENEIILELKAVEEIKDIHKYQLLTYLKLSNKKLGLLINFNVALLKNGIKRITN